jgi:hypothetical protein
MKPDRLPQYAPNFGRLAALLQVSRTHLRDVQQGDSRFPAKTPDGWPVVKVGLLLLARDYEKMTDAEFNQERHASGRETLRRIEAGGLPHLKRFKPLFEDLASARLDVNPANGEPARLEKIGELLESLERFSE